MTYRQRVDAATQLKSALRECDEYEERARNRKLSLTASECFSEGYERGVDDARDGYTGALDRIASRTLGNDYAYPESYRNGYLAGYEPAQSTQLDD